MKLIVNEKDISPHEERGMFIINLDPKSMMRVYNEQNKQLVAEEIACEVDARIWGCKAEDSFSKEWVELFSEKIASKVIAAIDGNDWIDQQRAETISECVEKGLRAAGIDPDTMKKGDRNEG